MLATRQFTRTEEKQGCFKYNDRRFNLSKQYPQSIEPQTLGQTGQTNSLGSVLILEHDLCDPADLV